MTTFLDPDVRRDPYPHYRELLAESPVHPSPLGGWLAVSHAAVSAVLHDDRLSSGRQADLLAMVLSSAGEPGPFVRVVRDQMVFKDPPEHTALRRLVNRGFTPAAVDRLRPEVTSLVDRLLAGPVERGRIDVIAELAVPLPALVICELLGLPVADRDRFQAWSADMILAIDLAAGPDIVARADVAVGRFERYLRALFDDRRRRPQLDVLSALAVPDDGGGSLTEDELVAMVLLLLLAGYETTTNLIGNGALALATHPEFRDGLVEDPGLVRSAVDELLRFDAPVQLVIRTATEPFDLCGTPVAAGDQVVALLGAANHDPAVFVDPERLDARRSERALHRAFGHGVHHCLGAPLARLEGEVAFGALLAAAPGLARESDDELVWRTNIQMRGLTALPLAW